MKYSRAKNRAKAEMLSTSWAFGQVGAPLLSVLGHQLERSSDPEHPYTEKPSRVQPDRLAQRKQHSRQDGAAGIEQQAWCQAREAPQVQGFRPLMHSQLTRLIDPRSSDAFRNRLNKSHRGPLGSQCHAPPQMAELHPGNPVSISWAAFGGDAAASHGSSTATFSKGS
jgi:hypothetical protein